MLSSAAKRTPGAVLSLRGCFNSDKIKLLFVRRDQSIFTSEDVVQVNISAVSGDMGILANHAPSIEPLRPGIVEVIESGNTSRKWFVSGGYANIHPGNKLTINVVEGAPLESFSPESARTRLQEARKIIAGDGSEEDRLEAQVEADIYEALQRALGST